MHFLLQQNVRMECLVKTAHFLAIVSMKNHVITLMVDVLTIYVHQAGRVITAAQVGVCYIEDLT